MTDAYESDGEHPAIDRFRKYLESCRYKKTPERFAILDKALSLPDHFEADDLYVAMESEGYHVSRGTVYSTLELLCDSGLLNKHLFGGRKARYEAAVGNHFHLVCQKCGSVKEVDSPDIDIMLAHLGGDGFRPSYFSTVVYGLCGECLRKSREVIREK